MKKNHTNHTSQTNHKNHSSDKWLRFLRWFCPDHLYEEIEGDLIQKFQRDLKTSDTLKVSDAYRKARIAIGMIE